MRYNNVFSGMNYQERQAYRAKRKGELATEKAAKQATAKTCQCCARQIFAETGTIAHHGYERPGYGYQTASCMGAKYLPFEVSRDRLGDLIEMLKDRMARQIEARAQAEAEAFPVSREYMNHNAPRSERVNGAWGRLVFPTIKLDFTRENFADLIRQNTGEHLSHKLFTAYSAGQFLEDGFDKIKSGDLDSRDHQIKLTSEHLAECEKRFAGWQQTLKRAGDEWVKFKTEV